MNVRPRIKLTLTQNGMAVGQKGDSAYVAYQTHCFLHDIEPMTEEEYFLAPEVAKDNAAEAARQAQIADDAAREASTATQGANEAAQGANTATVNAVNATSAANETAEHPTYIGHDHYVYRWNSQTKAYDKTDIYCKGDAFSITKVYPSIAAMDADFGGSDTKVGDFVLIETGDVEDPDNSKLFVKTDQDWAYLTDISGAIGFTGKTPQLSIGTVTTGPPGSSVAVTISDDGLDGSGNPMYRLNFSIPEGDTGKVAQFSAGEVITGEPGTQAVASITDDGEDEHGNPKKKLNLIIPRGDTGKSAYQEYFDSTTDEPKLLQDEWNILQAEAPSKELQRQANEEERITNEQGRESAIAAKADKVIDAVAGNLAELDENGNLVNSNKKKTDFVGIGSITSELGSSEEKVVSQKGMTDAIRAMAETWVGVVIDPSLSSSEPAPKSTVIEYRATELKRIGNLEYHKFGKSRIFNAFYPAIVVRSTKEVAWRLQKNDFTKKIDGTPSNPDWTIHNICIVIPDLYRRVVLIDDTLDGKYELRYDVEPFEGAERFHEESFHSISDAQVDRTNNHLVSVVSDDVRFRGGNNSSSKDSKPWMSQLGMPATAISRNNFETYANNAGWETMNIYDWTLFSELAMIYFANSNVQLAFTTILTAEGCPQGGLGGGNTGWISKRWDERNGYCPLEKVGEGAMVVGCNVGTAVKTINDYYIGAVTGVANGKCVALANFSTTSGWLSSYVGYIIRNLSTGDTATITARDDDDTLTISDDIFTEEGQIFHIEGVQKTWDIPVFFGLESLYGHIWKFCSGVNFIVQSAEDGGLSYAYVNPDWATRSSSSVDGYLLVGEIPTSSGYIKTLHPGLNIPSKSSGAGSNAYMSDYLYVNIPDTGTSLRALLVAGRANNGARAGLRFAYSHNAPAITYAYVGARLRAKNPK